MASPAAARAPASYWTLNGSLLVACTGTDTLFIPRSSVGHIQITGTTMQGYRLTVYTRLGNSFFESVHPNNYFHRKLMEWLAGKDILPTDT